MVEIDIPDSVALIVNYAFKTNSLNDVTLPAHFEDNPPVDAFDLGVPFSYADPVNPEPEPDPSLMTASLSRSEARAN